MTTRRTTTQRTRRCERPSAEYAHMWPIAEAASTESFSRSLGYALQRALQLTYQVEEQELAVELIGRGAQQRLLLWEAAEGGIGIWDRLVADPRAFAELGAVALRICHFDPATAEP